MHLHLSVSNEERLSFVKAVPKLSRTLASDAVTQTHTRMRFLNRDDKTAVLKK